MGGGYGGVVKLSYLQLWQYHDHLKGEWEGRRKSRGGRGKRRWGEKGVIKQGRDDT